MSSPKKPAEPETSDSTNWYAKKAVAAADGDLNWLDRLTPAEKRQLEAEERWAMRACDEDLPGPSRITVTRDFLSDF
jgi:hypothetical protein